MLLNEFILATDAPEREDPKVALQKAFDTPHLSVTEKDASAHIKPEEVEEMIAAGVDPNAFHVPVLFGYRMPISAKAYKQAQDAIKMRGAYTPEDVGQEVTRRVSNFVDSLLVRDWNAVAKSKYALKPSRPTLNAITKLRNMAKTGNVIIVTMPSSSPLPTIIAHELKAQIPGATIAPPGFVTKTAPKVSKQLATKMNLDLSKIPDYAALEDEVKQLQHAVDAQTDHSSPKYKELVAQLRKAQIAKDKLGAFQRKKYMLSSKTGYGRVYYQWMKTAGTEPIPSNVIIVDDNIVGGDTMADVAKALIRHNRAPLEMMGVVLHQFKSKSTKQAAAQDTSAAIKPHVEGCTFSALRALLG